MWFQVIQELRFTGVRFYRSSGSQVLGFIGAQVFRCKVLQELRFSGVRFVLNISDEDDQEEEDNDDEDDEMSEEKPETAEETDTLAKQKGLSDLDVSLKIENK